MSKMLKLESHDKKSKTRIKKIKNHKMKKYAKLMKLLICDVFQLIQ